MHVGLVGIGEMARRMGVTVATLRRWERVGKIQPKLRTLGGHRRYDPAGPAEADAASGKTVIYARVSSSDSARTGGSKNCCLRDSAHPSC
jgi:predicted site-specific integrase-resolvase